jgi:hypothetical protein
MSDEIVLLYDPALRRVGCPLLQAAGGCDYSQLYRLGFDTDQWTVAPTPDLRRVVGTESEWRTAANLEVRND